MLHIVRNRIQSKDFPCNFESNRMCVYYACSVCMLKFDLLSNLLYFCNFIN